MWGIPSLRPFTIFTRDMKINPLDLGIFCPPQFSEKDRGQKHSFTSPLRRDDSFVFLCVRDKCDTDRVTLE